MNTTARISEALAIAVRRQQAGQLRAAEQNHADAWHLLGIEESLKSSAAPRLISPGHSCQAPDQNAAVRCGNQVKQADQPGSSSGKAKVELAAGHDHVILDDPSHD
jgi:hypothetical protein